MPEPVLLDFTTFFLLPFRFAPRSRQQVPSTAQLARTREQLVRALSTSEGNEFTWRRNERIAADEDVERFAERKYLHPFAWRVVRDQARFELVGAPWAGEEPGSVRSPISWDGSDRKARTAELVGCTLHLFDQGVGVLSIQTEGSLSLNDLLPFHDQFRRVSRAYVGGSKHTRYRAGAWSWTTFPDVGRLTPDDLDEPWANGLVCGLLGPFLSGPDARHWRITAASDDRMLIHSWVGGPHPVPDDAWLRLLFVDWPAPDPLSCNGTDDFVQELRARHEYRRWWTDHRIGFTRYSGVFAGQADASGHGARRFFATFVRDQVKGVYHTLAVLTLVHRARLEALTDESAELMLRMQQGRARATSQDIRRLRHAVLLFSTRYWFAAVSHQDQGIEMGQKWAEIMGSPTLMADIRDEVERFEAFESQRIAGRTERAVTSMTVVLGVLALWAGLLGANLPAEHTADMGTVARNAVVALVGSVGLVAMLTVAVNWWLGRLGKRG